MSSAPEIWNNAQAKLESIINNDDIFTSYISVNKPLRIEGNTFILGIGEPFLKDWLENNYRSLISDAIASVSGCKYNVVWEITAPRETGNHQYRTNPAKAKEETKPAAAKTKNEPRLIGDLNSDFTFDEFVVGPSNNLTHAAARAVAENPGRGYNPLFIYGDTGLGKTHLMQAVGHDLLKKGKKVAYVTTETLLNEFTNAILKRTTNEFRSKYRRLDLLMIDDIQFFAEKSGIQEEFFHTFNALYQEHKQIIITSDRAASNLSGLEDRLISRFNQGLSVQMESPNFEMRLAILRYKESHHNFSLGEEAETFIARNVKSNVRMLEGALNRVIAYTRLNPSESGNIANLRYILRDLINDQKEEVLTAETIRKTVCEFYNVDIEDLNKEGRLQSIVLPRQAAMFLCRILTESSLPHIAKTFNRTHANIYHACTKMKKLYQTDHTVKENLSAILQKLGRNPSILDEA